MPISESDFSSPQLAGVRSKIGGCSVSDILHALLACGFDPAQYIALNRDLSVAQFDEVRATAHYMTDGAKENRIFANSLQLGGLAALCSATSSDPGYQKTLVHNVLFNQARAGGARREWSDAVAPILEDIGPTGATPYFLIGDSHSNLYGWLQASEEEMFLPMHYLCTGGSAMGLGNDRSRSNYGNKILKLIENIENLPSDITILFKFGQVDAEFSWIFNRIRGNRKTASIADFEEFSASSVERYRAFLEKCLARLSKPERVKVCSIFPPTLSDQAWAEGYVNAHIGFLETDQTLDGLKNSIKDLEINDLFTRTQMHSVYNALLRKASAYLGLVFVDDFSPLIAGNGTVAKEFIIGHDGSDHHLPKPTIQPIINRIVRTYCCQYS